MDAANVVRLIAGILALIAVLFLLWAIFRKPRGVPSREAMGWWWVGAILLGLYCLARLPVVAAFGWATYLEVQSVPLLAFVLCLTRAIRGHRARKARLASQESQSKASL